MSRRLTGPRPRTIFIEQYSTLESCTLGRSEPRWRYAWRCTDANRTVDRPWDAIHVRFGRFALSALFAANLLRKSVRRKTALFTWHEKARHALFLTCRFVSHVPRQSTVDYERRSWSSSLSSQSSSRMHPLLQNALLERTSRQATLIVTLNIQRGAGYETVSPRELDCRICQEYLGTSERSPPRTTPLSLSIHLFLSLVTLSGLWIHPSRQIIFSR